MTKVIMPDSQTFQAAYDILHSLIIPIKCDSKVKTFHEQEICEIIILSTHNWLLVLDGWNVEWTNCE